MVECCDELEMRNSISCHCSEFQTGITLSFLRLKICGLLFWIAYDVSYKFDVSSFRI